MCQKKYQASEKKELDFYKEKITFAK